MKEILKLIESVDPSDTVKLEEIDGHVNAYLLHRTVKEFVATPGHYHEYGYQSSEEIPSYTRSRDALKAIRPVAEGGWWRWEISTGNGYNHCEFTRFRDFGTRKTPYLATEELVELHAIIQAIAHERGEK